MGGCHASEIAQRIAAVRESPCDRATTRRVAAGEATTLYGLLWVTAPFCAILVIGTTEFLPHTLSCCERECLPAAGEQKRAAQNTGRLMSQSRSRSHRTRLLERTCGWPSAVHASRGGLGQRMDVHRFAIFCDRAPGDIDTCLLEDVDDAVVREHR